MTVTFADVAGVDSAKEELTEVVSVMKAAKASYSRLKVKMPSGVLLCGPPGTGKTLLGECQGSPARIRAQPAIQVSWQAPQLVRFALLPSWLHAWQCKELGSAWPPRLITAALCLRHR